MADAEKNKESSAPEDVLEIENAEPTAETASDTIVTKKESENPIVDLNKLFAEKEAIENKLSKENLSYNEKKDLLREKKEKSLEIIKSGCSFLGRKFEDEQEKIDNEEQRQLKISLAAFFGSEDIKAQQLGEQQMLAGNESALERRYDDIIAQSKLLSPEQEEALVKQGELYIGKRVTLSREDLAICIKAGLDVTDIKRALGGWISNKITIGGETFNDINGLNNFIATQKKEFLKEEAEKRLEQRKELTINQSIEQTVLDGEINGIAKAIKEKQAEDKETERTKQIEELKDKWEKAKKIFEELKLKPKKGGKTKEDLEKEKGELSDEIINLANKILGEKLRQEARAETGYDPDEKNKKVKENNQKKFRTYLTERVAEIIENKPEEIPDTKAKAKKPVIKISPKNEELEATGVVVEADDSLVHFDDEKTASRVESAKENMSEELIEKYQKWQELKAELGRLNNEGWYSMGLFNKSEEEINKANERQKKINEIGVEIDELRLDIIRNISPEIKEKIEADIQSETGKRPAWNIKDYVAQNIESQKLAYTERGVYSKEEDFDLVFEKIKKAAGNKDFTKEQIIYFLREFHSFHLTEMLEMKVDRPNPISNLFRKKPQEPVVIIGNSKIPLAEFISKIPSKEEVDEKITAIAKKELVDWRWEGARMNIENDFLKRAEKYLKGESTASKPAAVENLSDDDSSLLRLLEDTPENNLDVPVKQDSVVQPDVDPLEEMRRILGTMPQFNQEKEPDKKEPGLHDAAILSRGEPLTPEQSRQRILGSEKAAGEKLEKEITENAKKGRPETTVDELRDAKILTPEQREALKKKKPL